jgi:hypothetical protein
MYRRTESAIWDPMQKQCITLELHVGIVGNTKCCYLRPDSGAWGLLCSCLSERAMNKGSTHGDGSSQGLMSRRV